MSDIVMHTTCVALYQDNDAQDTIFQWSQICLIYTKEFVVKHIAV